MEEIKDEQIPEEVKNIIKCSTVEQVVEYLKNAVTASDEASSILNGVSKTNTSVVDISVMITPDGGKTWIKADETNFPSEGADILIPYPEGVDIASNDFIIGHLVAHGYNNAKVGSMEYFTPEKTAEGLKIHVTSTSPFVIAWKEAVNNNDTVIAAANDKASEQSTETAAVTEPVTKDNMIARMMIMLSMMMVSGVAIVYTSRKKRVDIKH